MRNTKGSVSVLEIIVIPLLIVEVLYLLWTGFSWYHRHVASGNDNLKLNTCESVAKVNSLNGMQCPVNGCDGTHCTHHITGGYIGFYDNVSNTIVGEKTQGYNESEKEVIGKEEYFGEVNSLVIEVKVINGELKYRWVKGVD